MAQNVNEMKIFSTWLRKEEKVGKVEQFDKEEQFEKVGN